MGERAAVPLVAALLAVFVALAPAVVTAQTSTTLELQEAVEDDTAQGTLSYTFTVRGENETRVSITSATTQSRDGGDVELNFQGWEAVGGSGSGSGSSWTASGGERYRVVYSVSAQSGAGEGSYSFGFRAEDDRGNSYSTTLSAEVEVLSPRFGTTSAETTDVVFGPDAGSSAEVTVDGSFRNEGEGLMLPQEVTYSGVPSGITARTESLPDQVGGDSTGEFEIDVSVDDSVREGRYDFTATVTDSLGNSVRVPVTVRVFKPPAVVVRGGDRVDLGEVMVGDGRQTEVTLSEATGNGGIDELEVTSRSGDQFGSIDLSRIDGASIRSGGSISRTVAVTADSEAPQGRTLEWTADITPRNAQSPTERVTFTATVIYPPYYDGVTAEEVSLVYDEPRSTTDSFTTEIDVPVRNGGDLPMDLTDATVTTAARGVSVEVVAAPNSIDARSSGTVVVEVTGDADAAETTSRYTVTLDAVEAGRTEATGELSIVHRTDLATDDRELEFGEIPVRESRTRRTSISERLGYRDVENFTVERTAGPDRWLEVLESPESLGAGEEQEFLVDVTFDSNATLYETYRWEFRVDGDNVESETVEVTAVPIPVQCTRVRDQLEGYEGDERSTTVARSMAEAISTLEDRLRENPQGSGPLQDLSRACTAGRSTLLFLNADEEAGSRIDAGNRSAAQTYIGRMAAGFNTMESYVGLIETESVRSTGEESVGAARSLLNERVESQTRFYEESVSDNATVLRTAEVNRELARLATLQGEERRARELGGRADEAFDRYATLVSEGNDHLLGAREMRETMDQRLFVEVVGVRAFWIGSLDRFESDRDAVLSRYGRSVDSFARAGATQRAAAAAEERAATARALQRVYWVSLGAGGAAGVVLLLVLGFEARGIYRYVQDSREMVSGDFLL